jgi:hypothetical protein
MCFLLSEYFINSKANWRALASAVTTELLFGKGAEKISFQCTAVGATLFWSFDLNMCRKFLF